MGPIQSTSVTSVPPLRPAPYRQSDSRLARFEAIPSRRLCSVRLVLVAHHQYVPGVGAGQVAGASTMTTS